MAAITKETIQNLANDDPLILLGIRELLNGDLNFRSFERALSIIPDAKNDHYLHAVEAGFQITINEIRKLDTAKSPYLDPHKRSLFLYTLQSMIFNLAKWTFKNGQANHFVPNILQKYRHLLQKSKALGVEDDVIHMQCFSKDYQEPNDPILSKFEFLDEQKMDAFDLRLRRYLLTQNPNDFFESTQETTLPKQTPKLQHLNLNQKLVIEKIIERLKLEYGVTEVDIIYFSQNVRFFCQILSQITGIYDPDKLQNLTKMVYQHLQIRQQNLTFKTDKR